MRALYFLTVVALAAVSSAQGPPPTDIHICELSRNEESLAVGPCRPVTDRSGYDNQPAFTADGEALLYTSMRGRSDDATAAQTDIYRHDLGPRETVRLTATDESEYSPTPLPDGAGFSVVRVEADGAQRLWRFAADGGSPSLLLPEVAPVGYHAWLAPMQLALFILDTPHELHLAELGGDSRKVAENIGRALHRIPGTTSLSFVSKAVEGGVDGWRIERLDPKTRARTVLAPTRGEHEDFVWTPGGDLLMVDGVTLHRWDGNNEAWREVANLGARGLAGVSRLAVSAAGDRLAVVVERPEAQWFAAIRRYRDALERHDGDQLAAVLAPDSRLWFGTREGPGRKRDPTGRGPWADWDRFFRSESTLDRLELVAERRVRTVQTEINDWFRLVERPASRYYITYDFDRDGRIAGTLIHTIPDAPKPSDRLGQFEVWAQAEHPGLLAKLMPEGEIDPRLENAKLWKRMLSTWREAAGLDDPLAAAEP